MSYHRTKRALSRKTGQRKALLKALAVALVMEEKIQTSEPKAKELRPFIERLITQGKKGNELVCVLLCVVCFLDWKG